MYVCVYIYIYIHIHIHTILRCCRLFVWVGVGGPTAMAPKHACRDPASASAYGGHSSWKITCPIAYGAYGGHSCRYPASALSWIVDGRNADFHSDHTGHPQPHFLTFVRFESSDK